MPKYEAIVPYEWEDRLPFLDLAFPIEEYEGRVARVRAAMAREGLDCLLAFGGPADPSNVRYLSNHEPSHGDNVVVVPAEGDLMLSTNWLMHGEPMHTLIWMTWVRDVRPTWSPDGKRLAFASNRHATSESDAGDFDVYDVSIADGTVRRLTHDPAVADDPSYSPDGKRIFFTSTRDATRAYSIELYAMPAGGGEQRRLTRDEIPQNAAPSAGRVP